jgi:DNA polymerase III subunit beta
VNFDCDVKMLGKALGALVRVVPQRPGLPILSHILLEAAGDSLTLTATDLEFGARLRVPAEVIEAGVTTVPARLLADVIAALKTDRVTIALKENRLRIAAGRSSTVLHTTDPDDFPPGPEPAEGDPIRVPREELLAAIEQVRPAVSTDSARAVLTGVLLRLDGSHLVLASTDGHRLVERRVDGVTSPPETAIVPLKALAELGRAFKEETGDIELRFAAARNQIFFRCGSAEVTSRLIEGQYPNYDGVIPKQASTVVRAPRAELARAVRMVGVVSESTSTRLVSLLVDAGSIRLLTEVAQVGEAEAEIEADVEGKAVHIALNSRFLLDALAATDVERVELRLDGSQAPALIRGVGAESCTCVLMPIRLAAPPRAAVRSQAA